MNVGMGALYYTSTYNYT